MGTEVMAISDTCAKKMSCSHECRLPKKTRKNTKKQNTMWGGFSIHGSKCRRLFFFFFNQKSWFLNESTDLLVESIISYTFYKTDYPESTLILSKQQIDPPFARTWWNRNSVTRKSQHENYILAGGEKNSSHALIRLVWKPLPDLKHGADCKHLGKSYYTRKGILWTPAHQFTLLSVCSLWPTLTIWRTVEEEIHYLNQFSSVRKACFPLNSEL